MASKVAYIVKESGVTLFKDGRQFSAPSDFWSFNRIIEKIKSENFDGIEDLFNTKDAVESVQKEVSDEVAEITGEEVRITNGEVFVGGRKVYNSVSKRLVNMLSGGFDVKPLSNFLKRLLKNPSRTAIEELYPFMEKADVTIDVDGYIIAYKKVKDNYFDMVILLKCLVMKLMTTGQTFVPTAYTSVHSLTLDISVQVMVIVS
jgi:hypothetical protein